MAIMLRILRKETWERVSAPFNERTVIGPGGNHGFYSVKCTDELQMAEATSDGSEPLWVPVPVVTIPAGEHPNVKARREEREAMLKKQVESFDIAKTPEQMREIREADAVKLREREL